MILQAVEDFTIPLYLPGKETMSDEELYQFCLANKHLRIERDENKQIIVMSPIGGRTSKRHVKFVSALDQWNDKYKLGEVFDSSGGFTLPDESMRNPDAAWVLAEKWNGLSAEQQERFLPFAPDFLVEVQSPTDRLKSAQQKMSKWIQNGVRLAWLIVPKQETVFIYRADGTVDKVEGFDKKLSGEDVLPGFEFDLSVLL